MKIVRRMGLACLCAVAFAGVGGGAAYARTPTPTSTATPAPTATAIPVPLNTFTGSVWVDGRPAAGRIEARVGTVVCGDASPITIGGYGSEYSLKVASEIEKAGCGKAGAIITFFVDGRQANETATWDSVAGRFQHLTLIVGATFAEFFGNVTLGQMPIDERVVPFVGNAACGYQLNPWQGAESPYGYQVVVYSAGIQAGCGTEGTEVTFKLVDGQGNVIAVAPEKGVWHAWDGESQLPRLDLTMVQTSVRMPPTGDGRCREGNPWGRLSLLLGFSGVMLGVGGFALRERAKAR